MRIVNLNDVGVVDRIRVSDVELLGERVAIGRINQPARGTGRKAGGRRRWDRKRIDAITELRKWFARGGDYIGVRIARRRRYSDSTLSAKIVGLACWIMNKVMFSKICP